MPARHHPQLPARPRRPHTERIGLSNRQLRGENPRLRRQCQPQRLPCGQRGAHLEGCRRGRQYAHLPAGHQPEGAERCAGGLPARPHAERLPCPRGPRPGLHRQARHHGKFLLPAFSYVYRPSVSARRPRLLPHPAQVESDRFLRLRSQSRLGGHLGTHPADRGVRQPAPLAVIARRPQHLPQSARLQRRHQPARRNSHRLFWPDQPQPRQPLRSPAQRPQCFGEISRRHSHGHLHGH